MSNMIRYSYIPNWCYIHYSTIDLHPPCYNLMEAISYRYVACVLVSGKKKPFGLYLNYTRDLSCKHQRGLSCSRPHAPKCQWSTSSLRNFPSQRCFLKILIRQSNFRLAYMKKELLAIIRTKPCHALDSTPLCLEPLRSYNSLHIALHRSRLCCLRG